MNNKTNELYEVCKSNWRNGYKRTKGLEVAKSVVPSINEETYARTFKQMIYNELGCSSMLSYKG